MFKKYIVWFKNIGIKDVPLVGGKNASLGEMFRHLVPEGINIPNGFALTSHAYFYFLKETGVYDQLKEIFKNFKPDDIKNLQETGKKSRELILGAEIPKKLERKIIKYYKKLCQIYKEKDVIVAVRSSATAEDLPSIAADEMVFAKTGNTIKYIEIEKLFNLLKGGEIKDPIFVPSLNGNNKIEWCKIEDIYRHPAANKKLYKITTKSGREITITPNHSLLVLDPDTFSTKISSIDKVNENTRVPATQFIPLPCNGARFLNVKETIKNKDIIIYNGRVTINQKNTLDQQYGLPERIEINKDFAYFLGVYLAEGSIYEKKNCIDISCDTKEVLARVRNFYKTIGSYKSGKLNYKRKVRLQNAVLAVLLQNISGEALPFKGKGRSCKAKYVPEFIFSQPKEIIGEFLKGLFDGDGWIEKSHIGYASLSKKLIGGTAKLLELLQIRYHITKKCSQILIPASEAKKFQQLIGFSSESRQNKLKEFIKKFDKIKKHQDFIDTIPASKKIAQLMEESLRPKVELQQIERFVCPKCGATLCRGGAYRTNNIGRVNRYKCARCGFSVSEKTNLPLKTRIIQKYINYDHLGRFKKEVEPWNKGNRKSLRTYGVRYLKKIAKDMKSKPLLDLIDTDILWDKIKRIEAIKYSGFVYDFIVPGTQNFAAGVGGIMTHNTASFAGAQETYLNISGEQEVLTAVKKCVSSLFTDRAIAYRQEKGFDHLQIALSVGIQKMINSGIGSSGVMFTLDTETGFPNVVLINSIWGVGEMIVKGKITPDEFFIFKPTLKEGYKSIIVKNLGRKTKKLVYNAKGGLKEVPVNKEQQLKFSLSDNDIITLAKWACKIEDYYSGLNKKWMPQDLEWARDGKTGKLFIVQSRPETIHRSEKKTTYTEYSINAKTEPILKGIAIGDKIGEGKTRIVSNVRKMSEFKKGEILVTKMTDPDWVPIMKMASAIVTDEGSKTAHAAIVSRELGIPCIVGTEKATKVLKTGQYITVDCTQGLKGKIYAGKVPYEVKEYNLKKVPKTKVKISVNIGAPELAFKTSFLPVQGVGLAREEFIIAQKIKCHPMALYNFNKMKGGKLKKQIEEITIEHKDKKEFFIKELAEGIGQIAAAFYPQEVIVRFSDFKTNEYAQLIGGQEYEPIEENPMIGWRGASRYYDERFAPAFGMECEAIKRVRDVFGLKNVSVMVPFCRTPEEGAKVIDLMGKFGLKQEKDGLKAYVMCEIPSNVILADKFLDIFDGMSIGSNDLTQLTMGMDRDNAQISHITDERNEAVKELLRIVIRKCLARKKYVGICGDAPSTFVDFAEFLAKEGIGSMSLSPDAVVKTLVDLKGKNH